jgi:2-keto-4-pentenoate hydratase/2-oxohepta-3-ene-1,7-dioic acid hydratase in catechol pathway
MGPWLTTRDEFDSSSAELRTYLNGRLTQQGRTFGGTGWPTRRFLRPGDVVRIEIDGLGELSNPVVAYNARALARQCAAPVAVG